MGGYGYVEFLAVAAFKEENTPKDAEKFLTENFTTARITLDDVEYLMFSSPDSQYHHNEDAIIHWEPKSTEERIIQCWFYANVQAVTELR